MARLTVMLQGLLSAIVETALTAAGHAILRFFGWESAFELVASLFGLACIVTGFAMWWSG
jgi:hypothetical protein